MTSEDVLHHSYLLRGGTILSTTDFDHGDKGSSVEQRELFRLEFGLGSGLGPGLGLGDVREVRKKESHHHRRISH